MRSFAAIIATMLVVFSVQAAPKDNVLGGLQKTKRGLEVVNFLLSQNADVGEICYMIGALKEAYVVQSLGPDDQEIINYFNDLEKIDGFCLRKMQSFPFKKPVLLHNNEALVEAVTELTSNIDPLIKRYSEGK